jgi:hypothetical protein
VFDFVPNVRSCQVIVKPFIVVFNYCLFLNHLFVFSFAEKLLQNIRVEKFDKRQIFFFLYWENYLLGNYAQIF